MAGRGVDILLGGNPEGLARRECLREGLDDRHARVRGPLRRAAARSFKDECKVEGDKVRDLGGLYVLGTERHESRRIDNQLRGRAGRQGDPGESRFYLSLEDELMRLFATGLMQRVMDKSFPDDMPLESKMVSKAVERAQGTVEDRNFEIRKDVLKYDEVMNEQRKIIYKRRQQILDGEDLRDDAVDAIESDDQPARRPVLRRRVRRGVGHRRPARRRAHATSRRAITKEQLDDGSATRRRMEELLLEDATALYAEKEESIGAETLRDIERRVMLSVIDQHWREHLYEMDYLQEGINLRAMGQQDPLSEWQREGFDMFEAMMGQIEDDFVRYVFHLQVVVDERAADRTCATCSTARPSDPVQGSSVDRGRDGRRAAAARDDRRRRRRATAGRDARPSRSRRQPVRVEKTPGRNEPCFCGSGKKYKLCHGR